MSDEDGLASPLDYDVLALGDGGEGNLNLGLGQDIGGCGHVDEEVCFQDMSVPSENRKTRLTVDKALK